MGNNAGIKQAAAKHGQQASLTNDESTQHFMQKDGSLFSERSCEFRG